ncbi:MAG: MGH1-like glycoside hydrolase domain-containing protein [Thermoguttaceae bacterium]
MSLNRRQFLRSAILATSVPAILSRRLSAAQPEGDWTVTFEEAAAKIEPYIHCTDKAARDFASLAYQQCVLGKIRPPAPPLKHRFLVPGGGYNAQWIWDTNFVVDLLSILPDQREIVGDVFQNFWDYQVRWNAAMPEYRHDMVANYIPPAAAFKKQMEEHGDKNWDWKTFPAYSQMTNIGWGLERVYRRNGDIELVKRCLEPLERFHEWFWRERDVAETGLICLGAYSDTAIGSFDIVQQARFETFDYECCLDDMKMTPHPKRKGPAEGPWYGDISTPGNTSFLLLSERSLARLATIAGDKAMADRRRKRLDRGIAAMREHMWDQPTGTFLAVRRDSLEKIHVPTIGSWISLMAEVPTKDMAARMAETLATENWMTPLPVPTVGRHDPRWKSNGFWRGDVWSPTNYCIASGLAHYGYKDLAAKIADATVANALKVGINEHYDSITGKPLGVGGLGMSCTLLTMMLDGLTRNYNATVVSPDASRARDTGFARAYAG